MLTPTELENRLAELEARVTAAEAAASLARPARAETTWPRDVRTARTALLADSPVYPTDQDVRAFPIVFTDWAPNTFDRRVVTDRSVSPQTEADSELWLPPNVEVIVAWTGKRWQVIRPPLALRGKLLQDNIPAGVWGYDCDTFADGSKQIHVYLLNESTQEYSPQFYDEAETQPVQMTIYNLAGLVTVNKMLLVIPEGTRWQVAIEPCTGTCSGY